MLPVSPPFLSHLRFRGFLVIGRSAEITSETEQAPPSGLGKTGRQRRSGSWAP